MNEQVFRLPDLGEGLTEAEIIEWQVAEGDEVAIDQHVVVVETAKATVEVPCPFAGTVLTLHGSTGDQLEVGQPLITIAPVGSVPAASAAAASGGSAASVSLGRFGGSDLRDVPRKRGGDEALAGAEQYRSEERAGAEAEGSGAVLIGYGTGAPRARRRRVRRGPAPTPSAPTSSARLPSAPAPRADRGRESLRQSERPSDQNGTMIGATDGRTGAAVKVISPLVRRLAVAEGLDLTTVTPSGPGGVIRRKDVEDAAAARTTRPGTTPESAPASTTEDVRIPLRGVRRAMADKLSQSRREIPDATTWVDVDATGLMQAKDEIRAVHPDAGIGVLALMARICVAGLKRFPELNSSVDTDRQEIVQHAAVHLGFAAQSPRGLVVPVVHDAHRLTTAELAQALRELTARAREGQLSPAELTGGTFTLNNYGVFGVDGSTPIINHPEAAMLGVGRIIDKPWAHEGQLALRKVTQLSFTFDHRVCDGGTAGGFLRYVADCVERPTAMLAAL
ncbi:MAG TPA: dihydrolipoamide acetyltransferase family protein [Segeticoccus sp.]|uniref:dihydrolipoamide acetyltransferase family protein n=1 Tax=Segeticoccus sp. TaxID=2706531 RepID=UPI002D807AD4|nr:dihydrolipoamide acetyltransferase family protein [Segeticoccus sp.]HET8602057.1 dihydrolipoamide acetyltransferase family protein [Segeticoccus sp.]